MKLFDKNYHILLILSSFLLIYTLVQNFNLIFDTNSRLISLNENYLSRNLNHNKSDIIKPNPIALIKCANQTRCIQPQLQLKKTFNVYYCKHVGHGVRFYFLVREGLLLHPKIRLVSTPEAADVIVYLPVSADWHKTECSKPIYRNKTVILDEGDHPQLFQVEGTPGFDSKFLLLFKRSYVHRSDGKFSGYMNYLNKIDVLPMTYTIADAYVQNTFNTISKRDLDILCTLRGSKWDPVRLRVREWVQEYGKARGVKKYVAGEINSDSRTVVSKNYFGQMYRAKIIVTSNPSDWEGDFRLCEALASGALIFVDHMFVPRPKPLIHNNHIVYYDNNNKTDLFEKLDYYRKEIELSRRIALNGYIHAMKYHRASNLIDYVFRTLHVKQLSELNNKQNSLLNFQELNSLISSSIGEQGYTETGYHMRLEALELSKKI